MRKQYFPGEIYIDDDDPGKHPVVIVSREPLNRGDYVITIPFTTARVNQDRPNLVKFEKGQGGLDKTCVAHVDAIARTEISCLGVRLGKIGDDRHQELIKAIGYVLDATCFI